MAILNFKFYFSHLFLNPQRIKNEGVNLTTTLHSLDAFPWKKGIAVYFGLIGHKYSLNLLKNYFQAYFSPENLMV